MRIGEAAHPRPRSGRDSRRRRRVSSSDDEGGSGRCAVGATPLWWMMWSATQWEIWRQFSLYLPGVPEFFSTRTPVSLVQSFHSVGRTIGPGPQLHVLSEGTCSTESDTESVACEPRIRRRTFEFGVGMQIRLTPSKRKGEKLCQDSHDERLARVRQLMQEDVRRGQHEDSADVCSATWPAGLEQRFTKFTH